MFAGLHHAQLAMPQGEEARARDFFVGVLGMTEIAKPPVLAERGGAWFRAGGLELHLGVEPDFQPARKAHPGVLVDDLDALGNQLVAAEHFVRLARRSEDLDNPCFRNSDVRRRRPAKLPIHRLQVEADEPRPDALSLDPALHDPATDGGGMNPVDLRHVGDRDERSPISRSIRACTHACNGMHTRGHQTA